jgi:hypothetical protein
MDRRGFMRRTVSAVAVMALVLAGCGAPPADAPVAVDRIQGQNQLAEEVAQPLEEDWGVACPAGFVNDPYPGHCKRYVDANGNGVCDLSEPGSGDYRPRT